MLDFLGTGFGELSAGNIVLICVGLTFIYLAITKKWEPYVLLPVGVGAILANLPGTGLLVYPSDVPGELGAAGFLGVFIEYGLVRYTILPILIFIGLGAMTDFGPLIANPRLFLLGAARRSA